MTCTRVSTCLEKISASNKVILFFLLSVFLFSIREGAVISPDSSTYVNHSIFRMGLYPLSISLFTFLFKGYAFDALAGFQLALSLGASYCLATFLQSAFKLPSMLRWVLLSVFLIPIVFLKSANDILSEGLAYPLFLLTSYFLLKGIFHNKIKELYKFSLTIFLLVFTRQQYMFFYGVAILLLSYLIFFQPGFQKKTQFFFSIVLSLATFFIAERTYHYVYHNTFSGTPFTGTQLVIRPLFLCSEDSYKAIEDPKQSQFVKEGVQNLLKQNLIDPIPNKRELTSFELSYNDIYQTALAPLWKKIWSKESLDKELRKNHTDYEIHQIIDRETISVSLMLIKINFLNYTKSYIKDVIRGYGGYAFFGFVFFTTLFCFWNMIRKRNTNPFHLCFVFCALIHFGNLTLVCLVEPPIMRYTYSTSLLLLSMLLIMAYQFTTLSTTDPSCAE